MKFEWDEDKSEACFHGRGFDFEYASCIFADRNRIVEQDCRRDYGEDRYQVYGMIDERIYVVVYTPREPALRIISARKANRNEIEYYENNVYRI